ncbi:hypothetical protein [Musicola paradisiaca]|nr:hypothetical protein [Musicola paradisiaca]
MSLIRTMIKEGELGHSRAVVAHWVLGYQMVFCGDYKHPLRMKQYGGTI